MLRHMSMRSAATVALMLLTAACGGPYGSPSTLTATQSSNSAAAPSDGTAGRIVIKEYPTYGAIGRFLGSEDRWATVQAVVTARHEPVRGPASAGGSDGAGSEGSIYTPFTVDSVQTLRGPKFAVERILIEGGSIDGETVKVEDGALEPEVGATVYAVLDRPSGVSFPENWSVAGHVFPVTSEGDVFLPHYVVLDERQPPPPANVEYRARSGSEREGRAAPKDEVERAIRAS